MKIFGVLFYTCSEQAPFRGNTTKHLVIKATTKTMWALNLASLSLSVYFGFRERGIGQLFKIQAKNPVQILCTSTLHLKTHSWLLYFVLKC